VIGYVRRYWRFLLFLVIVDLVFLYLATGGVYKVTSTVWAAKVVVGCELDFWTSRGVVALGCPGVDFYRLWPLPVVHPWFEDPDPTNGWIAEEQGAPAGRGG
jgi:hypothetical protein